MRPALLVIPFLLSACADIDFRSSEGGRVHHVGSNPEQIQSIADRECARYGKVAVVGEADGGWTTRRGSDFECIAPD